MPLIERCQDCDWRIVWDGGSAAEDPAVDHADDTGHKVRTSAGPKPDWATGSSQTGNESTEER